MFVPICYLGHHTDSVQAIFKTEVSYFEIYSENIFDLLAAKTAGPKRKVCVYVCV